MATEILSFAELAAAQANKFVTYNEGMRRVEGMTVRVLSRTNSGPPVSPTNGDTYIIDSATGAWSSFSVNNIAHYFGGEWRQYVVVEGVRVSVNDEDVVVRYTGSAWVNSAAESVGVAALTNNSIPIVNGGLLTEDTGFTIASDLMTVQNFRANLTDNLAAAFRALQGSDIYIQADTTNGSEKITLGASAVNPEIEANGSLDVNVPDNNANAFSVAEGANNLLLFDTTNSSEKLDIGNAVTNMAYNFLGSGAVDMAKFSIGGGSDTWDHLEAGTWTPALAGSTTAGSHTYSVQSGTYFRFGKLTFVEFKITITTVDAAMAGSITITGLPQNITSTSVAPTFVVNQVNHVSFNDMFALQGSPNEARMFFHKFTSSASGTTAGAVPADIGSAPIIAGSGIYVSS